MKIVACNHFDGEGNFTSTGEGGDIETHPYIGWSRMSGRRMSGPSRRSPRHFLNCDFQQTGVYPTPWALGAGSARPNPKKGAPETENPLFIGFSALRGGLEPWSQTMVPIHGVGVDSSLLRFSLGAKKLSSQTWPDNP